MDYAALLNDDDDSDTPKLKADTVELSSDDDDDDDNFNNTPEDKSGESVNMFDSLKEDDSPVKKPPTTKRKLGPKADATKPAAKRSKKQVISDDDSDDFAPKVSYTTNNYSPSSTNYILFIYFSSQNLRNEKTAVAILQILIIKIWIFMYKKCISL